MILAIQESLVPGDGAAERMAAALDAGFDGLEVRDARPGRVAELAAAGGRITSCCPELDGWIGDFDAAARRRALDRLCRELDGMAALGGGGVITPAAWGMFTRRLPPFEEPPRTPDEDRAVLIAGLAELGAHAQEVGATTLALEHVLEPANVDALLARRGLAA